MSRVVRCANTEQVRQEVLKAIQHSVDQSDGPLFTVGVSGGSMVDVLSQVLPSVRTEWSVWRIFLCDERLVPEDDADSNYGQFKRDLLSRTDLLTADQFFAVNTALDGPQAANDYEQQMRRVLASRDWPRFDLLLLGMGPDGHTASLFPGHPALHESTSWVTYVPDSPKVSLFLLPTTPNLYFLTPSSSATASKSDSNTAGDQQFA